MVKKLGTEKLNCLTGSPAGLQNVARLRFRIVTVCAFGFGRRLDVCGGYAFQVRRDTFTRLVAGGDAGIAC